MKHLKITFIIALSILGTFTSQTVFAAGNIDSTLKYSQFLNSDLDNNATNDFINWKPANATVPATVTDTKVTGQIWGETVGWINLGPFTNAGPTAGVKNTCQGQLSGYAWGENTGWINFAPTKAVGANKPKINPNTGMITGTVWSQNYGWIQLSSPDGTNSGLKTSWDGCINPGGGPSYICSNGEDDDGDGLIDYPSDPGCISAVDNSEDNPAPTTYICSDGIDNDGDGLTDYPADPGCISAVDNSEQNTLPQTYICSNGIDDDGDGLTDYPADPGCTSLNDNSEDNQPPSPTCEQLGTCPPPPPPPDSNCVGDTCPPPPPNPGCTGNNCPPPPPGNNCIGNNCISTDKGDTVIERVMSSIVQSIKPIAVAVGTVGFLSTIPGFTTRITNLVFSIPFYRRRRPWGIVYDSESKQTIDPAYVTVYNADTNAVIDTKITDINGRYGFLLPVGNYRMTAQKTHYQFPSQKLAGRQSDEVYGDLYFGEVFTVTDDNKNAVVTLNMPMDRMEIDWNQEEKKRMGLFDFFTRNSKLWETISTVLFAIGFVFSIFAIITSPNIWNSIVFGLYIFFTLLHIVGFGPVSLGVITDATGKPVASAVIRVWSAHLGTQIAQRVTNNKGQYYLLLTNGDYYVTVDVKNASGGYDRLFTSETMKVKQGLINKSFQI